MARILHLIRGWCFVGSTALLEGRTNRMPTRTKPARHIVFLALLSPGLAFLSTPASAGCTSTPVAGLQVDCTDAIPPDPTIGPILIAAGNNELTF